MRKVVINLSFVGFSSRVGEVIVLESRDPGIGRSHHLTRAKINLKWKVVLESNKDRKKRQTNNSKENFLYQ